jgi:hypothetical protein
MKLVCPECRRENEPERIYCHDCGTRLDRSALRREKAKVEDPSATRKRLRSMFDPKGAMLKRRFIQASQLILGALLLAVLVQMFRAPDVPERPKTFELSQINLDLENAITTPGAAPLRYSDDQVNAYLGSTLKGKRKTLSNYLQFERAVVGLEENVCRATVERSIFGFSVFSTVDFTPQLENGKLTGRVLGGRIGRLPIHPALMKYADFLFADVCSALDRDRKLVAKFGAVEVHPRFVVLTPRQRP